MDSDLFSGLGSTLVGAGLGGLGSIIGGGAADRAARDARGAQRQTDRANITNQLALLRAFLEGTAGQTADTAAFAPEIAAQRAILTNPSSTLGQKQAAQKTLLRLEDRQRQTGFIGIDTPGLPGLREQIDAENARLLSEFDAILGPSSRTRADLASTLGSSRQFADALLANADQFGPAAIAAANAAVDRQVGEGVAAVERNAAQRGLARAPGGSSVVDSASVALRGDAAGGLAQALANIEAQKASLRSSALQQRFDLENAISGQLAGFDVANAGNRFGITQSGSDRRLGTFQQALDAIRGLFSPNALQQSVPVTGGSNIGSNIGTSLSAIGGQIAGAGLSSALDRLFGKQA